MAGESKMKVQKFKNNYSNKHAPGKDVATKYTKTEIVRHICTEGALSDDGKLQASKTVLEEAVKKTNLLRICWVCKRQNLCWEKLPCSTTQYH